MGIVRICSECGESHTREKVPYCYHCGRKHMVESATQILKKEGPYYEKWRMRWEASRKLQVTKKG